MKRCLYLACVIVPAAIAACSTPPATGSASAALTADQCMYFAENGKETICHATGAPSHPYAVIRVATAACVNAHAQHPGDFIAVDGSCGPGSCLAEDAPCDATLPCCDSLECTGGRCVAACAGAGPGIGAGEPGALATAQTFAGQIAVEGTSVFWGTRGPGWGGATTASVLKVPQAGGAAQSLAILGNDNDYVQGLAADATHVYYGVSDGTINKVPVGGGAATLLASPGIGVQFLAVDAQSVFFTVSVSGFGGVYAVPLAGGAVTPIESSPAQVCRAGITVDAANVYWAEDGCHDCSTSTGRLMKAPLAGGPAIALATGQGHPAFVAVDEVNAYWTNHCDGTVMKVPLAGGTPTILAAGQAEPMGIAVDAGYVYWTNQADGTVMRVSSCGGEPTELASGQNAPTTLATDGTSLFWADWTVNGSIVKLPSN